MDGLKLGTIGPPPRRWDASKLINLSGSQIPDVFLLDGSRLIGGDVLPDTPGVYALGLGFGLGYEWYLACIMNIYADSILPLNGMLKITPSSPTDSVNLETFTNISSPISFRSYDTLMRLCARLMGGRLDILRAGDVTFIDDRFLKLGKDSDAILPTASASYRGKMIRVEEAETEADKVCVCVKKADDTYGWFDLISGVFV